MVVVVDNMRWTAEMRDVISNNYPQKTYKELAILLGVSHRSIERQIIDMGLSGLAKEKRHNNKQNTKKIGCKRRANNKYNGILTRIRTTHIGKNSKYKGGELKVSRKDFIQWFMPLDFEGASVDRIDKNGHYELSNMQVISLAENIRKDKVKARNGETECYVCHKIKPIEEFSKNKRRATGHTNICILCDRERGREKYKRLYSKSKVLI